MVKKEEEQVAEIEAEVAEEMERNPVLGMVHRVLLAGIGAVALTQEEVERFVNKLVERGEEISNERREQAAAEAQKRQEKAKELGQNLTGAVGDTYNQYSNAALHSMNVPSRDDIQDLSKQIDALNRKVDRVRKEQKEKVAA